MEQPSPAPDAGVLLAPIRNVLPRLANFDYDDYRDEYLGEFIDRRVLTGERKRRSTYAADEYGTIRDKNAFAKKAFRAAGGGPSYKLGNRPASR